jgi:hypothetical protein
MSKCYMCDSKAVSREHIPPLCLFPESKDLPQNVDYRKNLITVPSCKKHNLSKSDDDEYLLFILTSNWSVNDIGLQHWKTKILRTLKIHSSRRNIYKKPKPINLGGIETGYFSLDFNRVESEIDKISRGIYYHHFHKPWLYKTEMVLPAAKSITGQKAIYNNQIILATDILISKFLQNKPIYGENQDIFKYSFRVNEKSNSYVVRMTFYGGINISVISNLPEQIES